MTPFRPNARDELTIAGVTYRVAEHPAAPGSLNQHRLLLAHPSLAGCIHS